MLALGLMPELLPHFAPLDFEQMVPAVGQGAIAVQCRQNDAAKFAAVFDAATARAVNLERAFQAELGGGCHTAFAAHVSGDMLHLFHEKLGIAMVPLEADDFVEVGLTAARVLREFNLMS